MRSSGKSGALLDRSVVLRYGVGALSAFAMLGIRLALDRFLGQQVPYLTFALAVIVASRIGGRGPGWLATAISVLSVWYFLLEPRYSFGLPKAHEAAGLALFLVVGVIISLIGGQARNLLEIGARNEQSLTSAQAALRASEERLRLAQEAAGIGSFEWNIQTGLNIWTPKQEELYGLPLGSFGRTQPAWESLVHPEDRAEAVKGVKAAFDTGAPTEREFRVVWPDGSVRWLSGRWQVFKDSDGTPARMTGVSIDITERKQVEEQLRQTQRTFSELVERAPFGIYVVDSQFRIAHMNAGSQSGAFRNVRPVIGRDFAEAMRILWPEPVAAGIVALFRHTLETGEPYQSPRFVNPRQDVETVEAYEWELHRMTLPDGQYGVICYYFDSTKLREAETALRESEERLRLAQEAAGIGTFEWNLKTGVNTWTPKLEELYGLPVGSFGRTQPAWESLVHPEDRADAVKGVKAAFDTGAPTEREFRVVWPDGSVHWLSGRWQVFKDSDGTPARMTGVNIDIAERKRAEDALRRQVLLVNLSHDAILVMDADRVIRAWNAGAVEMYGWTEAEVQGGVTTHVLFQTRSAVSIKQIEEMLKREGRWDGELVHTRRDGQQITVESRQVLVRDESGHAIGILEIDRDVTDRKRAEESLKHLNTTLERRVRDRTTQLESANAELQAFAYSVSHDLRAPLRSIDGFAKILLRDYRDRLDERAADCMERMAGSCTSMGRLIDDLLRLSRVTRAELSRQRIDLSQIAAATVAELQSRDPERSIQVEVGPTPEVDADPQLMRIVLDNLLGNAWKFTSKSAAPTIAFGAVQTETERIYFVKDNGVGFDMAHAGQLFAPFQRLHRANEFEGSGIGLATVQRVIRRHEGRIWAESQLGQGAAFYFTIGNL